MTPHYTTHTTPHYTHHTTLHTPHYTHHTTLRTPHHTTHTTPHYTHHTTLHTPRYTTPHDTTLHYITAHYSLSDVFQNLLERVGHISAAPTRERRGQLKRELESYLMSIQMCRYVQLHALSALLLSNTISSKGLKHPSPVSVFPTVAAYCSTPSRGDTA